METGIIVEYIDQQKIICSVVLEIKKQRLRLLTESNREINIASTRLTHRSAEKLNLSGGRDNLIISLQEKAKKRDDLKNLINVKELWELLNEETDWIDLKTMTEYCYTNPVEDHESAIVRAFFENRIYFKFNKDTFLPNSEKQIEKILTQTEAEQKRDQIIEDGSNWLKSVLNDKSPEFSEDMSEVIEILKSYYVLENGSIKTAVAKAILSRAGVDSRDKIFNIMVKLGLWDKDENIDVIRFNVPTNFSDQILKDANEISNTCDDFLNDDRRMDLTNSNLMTIDGQATLDFDDAISLEKVDDHYILGIHIIDVAHYIKKESDIDKEALNRASSIYMPDDKIPMLPPSLSEDHCSLKIDVLRPGISTLVTLNRFFEITDYKIVASKLKISQRLNYTETDKMMNEDQTIQSLYKIAETFQEKRLKSGAMQINLPEVNVWLSEDKEVSLGITNRENPGRFLVSEIMIMGNWLMGSFLKENEIPAIFRSQPEPKQRLYKGKDESLFLNCMQRKHLSRGTLGFTPEHHSGLGLDVYVTATSPIRKYFDLATQRQIRAGLGFEKPYTAEEIKNMIFMLEQPMSYVGRLQYMRRRYWILKYLEKQKGTKTEALVLESRKDFYIVLLKEYMFECKLQKNGINHKPKDLVQVSIQHSDARRNLFSIFVS